MYTSKLVAVISSVLLCAPAWSQDPSQQPDDSWIQISGTVESVATDSFTLDYGDGTITVEMDDADRDASAYQLLPDDKVTVSGLIDDHFYETTTIDARSIYVQNIGTTFYASVVDEDTPRFMLSAPVEIAEATVHGTVTSVDPEANEFTINSAARLMTVKTDKMSYDPLDEEGYQQIKVNDVVSVSGQINNDLFEGQVLEAEYVTTLSDKS
ncbi:hypothetical protein IDSA_05170 [Pseudidiomarina salinarum]|uniref:DUF5666 domain-containing protein n=1 Tax=Pseudidiomarina salinarum TaxID=435908 RepID=A0A094IWK2_9GAMM|nr:NirD/YgiW/YdeI family stress tolerance protein [Pseudidiomarina salinarum]KFZ32065.1 hypothetical protein IDSA_05170 [Pseudidiomarina salinarum]RUO70156.1 hypothetical protein CWI79_01415 [Pseudidiomarina salinarum]